MYYLLILTVSLIFGAVLGSFVGVLYYRIPKKITLMGRSYCDNCKRKVVWYDNIPLLSFIILHGKCRKCNKKIPLIYPLIEVSSALIFSLLTFTFNTVLHSVSANSPLNYMANQTGALSTLFLVVFVTVHLLAILLIDFKYQLIPDSLTFSIYLVVLLFILLFLPDKFYINILSGAVAGLSLLTIHLFTKGKGMGLGDVKLAVALGTIMGWPYTLIWIFLSFLTGAIAGIILIMLKKVGMKDKIAFGPFMIIAFYLTLFLGNILFRLLKF